jgi:hypothetical protein
MAEEIVHRVAVSLARNYEFTASFEQFSDGRPILLDELPPLGEGHGPNATALVAAAVGNCLAASLAFCLRKSRAQLKDLKAGVTARVTRTGRTDADRGYRSGTDAGPRPRRARPARPLLEAVRRFLRRDGQCPAGDTSDGEGPEARRVISQFLVASFERRSSTLQFWFIHVGTPSFGSTQACSTTQITMKPIGQR